MEEMNEIFYKNAYQKEFDATVLSCEKGKDGWEIILSDTAFYPEGGGQPGDRGTLNGTVITDTRRKDEKIVHYGKDRLDVGEKVHGKIDWPRRFDYMQNHSGEHIFSGLVHKKFGYDNVGFHMADDVVTIDFNGIMTMEEALLTEEEANEIIYGNEDVRIFLPDTDELRNLDYRSKKELTGPVRIVEFKGADICACCGTHVKKTGEIGMIKVISLINHKGGVRLQMVCGKRALAHFDKVDEANREIGKIFSAKPYETAEAAAHFAEEQIRLREKINELNKKYMKARAELLPSEKICILAEEGMTMMEIRKFCEYLLKEEKGEICAVLSPKDENGYNYAIGSNSVNLRNKLKDWNEKLHGKGGGKPEMVQGSFSSDLETIKSVLSEKE